MIHDICKDEFSLSQKAEPAADDLNVARDLLDTLAAHKDGPCSLMTAGKVCWIEE